MHALILASNSIFYIFSNFQILSKLHSFNLNLCSIQYNKKIVLHLIVAPQLGGGRQHNYSTKTRQAGRANEQSVYSLMSMSCSLLLRELKLSGNRIREFPEELVSLPRLKFLDLSLNEIETLQSTQVSFENFQVKTVF